MREAAPETKASAAVRGPSTAVDRLAANLDESKKAVQEITVLKQQIATLRQTQDASKKAERERREKDHRKKIQNIQDEIKAQEIAIENIEKIRADADATRILLAEQHSTLTAADTAYDTQSIISSLEAQLEETRNTNRALQTQIGVISLKKDDSEEKLSKLEELSTALTLLNNQRTLATMKKARLIQQLNAPIPPAPITTPQEIEENLSRDHNAITLLNIAKSLPGYKLFLFFALVFAGIFVAGLLGFANVIDFQFEYITGAFVNPTIINAGLVTIGTIFAGWYGISALQNRRIHSYVEEDPPLKKMEQQFHSTYAQLSSSELNVELSSDSYLMAENIESRSAMPSPKLNPPSIPGPLPQSTQTLRP